MVTPTYAQNGQNTTKSHAHARTRDAARPRRRARQVFQRAPLPTRLTTARLARRYDDPAKTTYSIMALSSRPYSSCGCEQTSKHGGFLSARPTQRPSARGQPMTEVGPSQRSRPQRMPPLRAPPARRLSHMRPRSHNFDQVHCTQQHTQVSRTRAGEAAGFRCLMCVHGASHGMQRTYRVGWLHYGESDDPAKTTDSKMAFESRPCSS